jgi:YbbR domain-containing protein
LTEQKKSRIRISAKKISDLKVVVLCIATATTFWILNALNKDDYTTVVDYPIEFVFDREKFIPIEELPTTIQVEIKGNGWDLLRKYFKLNSQTFPILIPKASEKNFLLASDLKRSLGEFLTPTQLISVLDDSVKYQIDEIITMKIKPTLDSTSYSMAKNIRLDSKISFSPDKLTIKGPESILRAMKDGFPIALNESKINKNIQKQVEITMPSKYGNLLSIKEEFVNVEFEVAILLEGNKRLKLRKINFPKSVSISNEQVSFMAFYLVDEKKAPELKDMEFEAVLDYSKRDKEDSTLFVLMSPNPKYLEQVRIEPPLIKLKYE